MKPGAKQKIVSNMKQVLLEELRTVTQAVSKLNTDGSVNTNDLETWTERLNRINDLLQIVEDMCVLTQDERNLITQIFTYCESGQSVAEDFELCVKDPSFYKAWWSIRH